MVEQPARTTLAILRRRQVQARTGLGVSLIYSMMAKGQFPKPVKLTAKAVGWPEHLIEGWIASRIAAAELETAQAKAQAGER